MNVTEAAEALGMKPNEVVRVDDSPAGPVAVTRDGVAYVWVPESNPDAAGQHGLMYVVAPTEHYAGALPVYAGPADDLGVDVDELARVRDAALPVDPAAGGPVLPTEATALDHTVAPVNSGDREAGPSAASAAHPAKVDAGLASTAPDPTVNTEGLDPGRHDPAAGGPVGEPPAVPPLAGDGPVGTAVIADVPSGKAGDILAWVGDNRGRAKQALAAERAATRPRSTLLAQLERLAANE